MADDDKKDTQGTATPVIIEPEAGGETLFGRPLDMFVRGGTHTSGHDRMMAERVADAEHRRDVAAKERQLAAVPIEDGGAQMFTNNLALNPQAEAASVLLKYCTPRGEVKTERGDELQCLADVLMVSPTELGLVLVCPGCKARGDHLGECQLRILQSNRKWYLDTSKAGELIVFEGKPYRSAGEVMDCERFSCPNCGWAARIHKNMVIPDR